MKIVAALAALAGLAGLAQADVLANWTFESTVPTTAGPHLAELGINAATSQASGSHAGTSTYSNPVGNGSAESFSSNNWQVGDYYQFTTSTLGYQSISFQIDDTSSGTGPKDFDLQYSTNGVAFTSLTGFSILANAAPNNFWTSSTYYPEHTYSFTLPAALDNQATIWIRVAQATTASANGGTVASAGTNRVDNVIINGTAVPAPASIALVGLAGLVAGRRRR